MKKSKLKVFWLVISDFWTILFPETMKLSECEQQQQDGDDNGGHLSI